MKLEEINDRAVKAAKLGLAQSLINRGVTKEAANKAANAYAAPDGLLAKRAAVRFQKVCQMTYNAIQSANK